MRISDWSSDVCSSDLQYGRTARAEENRTTQSRMTSTMTANLQNLTHTTMAATPQSELPEPLGTGLDRKSVVSGKSESVRVDLGGRRTLKKKTHRPNPVDTSNHTIPNKK